MNYNQSLQDLASNIYNSKLAQGFRMAYNQAYPQGFDIIPYRDPNIAPEAYYYYFNPNNSLNMGEYLMPNIRRPSSSTGSSL